MCSYKNYMWFILIYQHWKECFISVQNFLISNVCTVTMCEFFIFLLVIFKKCKNKTFQMINQIH